MRATAAYDGAARVVAWAACGQEGAEGRAVETGGRAGETGGRARGTGGRAGETGGWAGETGEGEREASPATVMEDDARPPVHAARGSTGEPAAADIRQGRARPPGDPGSGCFPREPFPLPPRPHAPPPSVSC